MGVRMGVDFANQRSLPPRGSQGGGVGCGVAVNCVFFHTCSEHRVEKSWEVPGMKGKVSSGVKDLREVCVKEPQPDHTARS